MELLKLSKLKFQLRALISEVKDLRVSFLSPPSFISLSSFSLSSSLLLYQESERSATEKLHFSIQVFISIIFNFSLISPFFS